MKKKTILLFPLSLVCLLTITGCKNPGGGGGGGGEDTTAAIKTKVENTINDLVSIPTNLTSLSKNDFIKVFSQATSNFETVRRINGVAKRSERDTTGLCSGTLSSLAEKSAIYSSAQLSLFNNLTIQENYKYHVENCNSGVSSYINSEENYFTFCKEDAKTNSYNSYNMYDYSKESWNDQKYVTSDSGISGLDLDGAKRYLSEYFLNAIVLPSVGKNNIDEEDCRYQIDTTTNTCYVISNNKRENIDSFENPINPNLNIQIDLNEKIVVKFSNFEGSYRLSSFASNRIYTTSKDLYGNTINPVVVGFDSFGTTVDYAFNSAYAKYDELKYSEETSSEDSLALTYYYPNGDPVLIYDYNDDVEDYVNATIELGNTTFNARTSEPGFKGFMYSYVRQNKFVDKKNDSPSGERLRKSHHDNPFITDSDVEYSIEGNFSISPLELDSDYLIKINSVNYDGSLVTFADGNNFDQTSTYAEVVEVSGEKYIRVKEKGYYNITVKCDADKSNKKVYLAKMQTSEYSTNTYFNYSFENDQTIGNKCHVYDEITGKTIDKVENGYQRYYNYSYTDSSLRDLEVPEVIGQIGHVYNPYYYYGYQNVGYIMLVTDQDYILTHDDITISGLEDCNFILNKIGFDEDTQQTYYLISIIAGDEYNPFEDKISINVKPTDIKDEDEYAYIPLVNMDKNVVLSEKQMAKDLGFDTNIINSINLSDSVITNVARFTYNDITLSNMALFSKTGKIIKKYISNPYLMMPIVKMSKEGFSFKVSPNYSTFDLDIDDVILENLDPTLFTIGKKVDSESGDIIVTVTPKDDAAFKDIQKLYNKQDIQNPNFIQACGLYFGYDY